MKYYRNIKLSVKALLLNKSRTFFSIIGMAVGIASVIVTVAIGGAAKQQAMAPIIAMGTNVIVVNAGKYTEVFGRAREVTNVTTLKLPDVEELKTIHQIERISPFQESSLQVKYKGITTTTLVQGVTSDYPLIRNYSMNKGDFFKEEHNRLSEKVAVLGSQMAEKLFKNENPLGKTIYINRISFTVTGVLNPKGSAAELGNIDNVVMIPVNTILRRVLNIDFLSKIYLQVNGMDKMDDVENELTGLLRSNHKLGLLKKDDDFTIVNQLNAIRASEETSKSFNFLILGVAAISLIIGGAGILAVMILSVRERITEIGLRISVGARKRNILLQFLSESFLLGCGGGIAGIFVGFITAFILNEHSDWPTFVSTQSIIISLVFSMFTGIIFGVFPAIRAANMNPIKALKSE